MKFLIDNQLQPVLTDFFRECGHESLHVLDIGMDCCSDLEIYEYAASQSSIIVSKDEDFLFLSRRLGLGAGFLWIRLGNCRKHVLLAALGQRWPEIEQCFEAGDRIVELR